MVFCRLKDQQGVWTDLELPHTRSGAAVRGMGWSITATYLVSKESISVNTGDRGWNVKESETYGVGNNPEILRCPSAESAWP
jgi:hypothetical protein